MSLAKEEVWVMSGRSGRKTAGNLKLDVGCDAAGFELRLSAESCLGTKRADDMAGVAGIKQ